MPMVRINNNGEFGSDGVSNTVLLGAMVSAAANGHEYGNTVTLVNYVGVVWKGLCFL